MSISDVLGWIGRLWWRLSYRYGEWKYWRAGKWRG